jgi:bifunctional DNA-binding transcriptional regulator/antitoxin component of YhaV-PrlF toxin-antitoxin module
MQARESTVSPVGTTTVPKRIRDALGLGSGGRIVWHLGADGQLVVRVKHYYALQRSRAETPCPDIANSA